MKITIIISDKTHKIFPYLEKWKLKNSKKHVISLVTKSKDIKNGDFLFLIACTEMINLKIRSKFKHTLLIHESNLPKGRGWSPLIWDILNGKNKIHISLLEAEDKVDSGKIWKKESFNFEGNEIFDEINSRIFPICIHLIDFAIKNYKTILPKPQKGKPIYYPKRTPINSEISINKSIKSQFNQIRIADTERYPCFFNYKGFKYKITITKM
jgi:methionyl-tRNA formyltransferase